MRKNDENIENEVTEFIKENEVIEDKNSKRYRIKIVKPESDRDYKIFEIKPDDSKEYKLILINPKTGEEVEKLRDIEDILKDKISNNKKGLLPNE